MHINKILFWFLFFIYSFNTYALDETFVNPTFSDLNPPSVSTTCSPTDPLWVDESDFQWVGETYLPHHYCVIQWYTTYTSYVVVDDPSSPWVCETNSNQEASSITWEYDATQTNVYDSITCAVSDSQVWCTFPNALNYDPNALVNDGSCFFSDSTWWTWTGTVSDVAVVVNNPSYNWEEIFTIDELYNFYMMEFTFLLLLALIIISKKFTPGSRTKKLRSYFK